MLLAMKDEAGDNLNDDENDFMLDNAYGDDMLEKLTHAVIMMAHIQLAYDKVDAEPKYDAEAILKVGLSKSQTSQDTEDTSEDAKEGRLKIKDEMIQLDYEKLNALYDTYVPKKEPSAEQTYFSTPSTSDVSPESSIKMSSKHMTRSMKMISNFIDKFIGMVRFGNDHFKTITGYGDYVQGIS
nr:integrase, catalytic region, zinc finger, CCHC-type, peptidase aspartic, catalytic [Tanacetum cinerariifolium]